MKIKLENGKISDFNNIIVFINNSSDIEYLNYLLDAIEEYQIESESILPIEFKALKSVIKNRLSALGFISSDKKISMQDINTILSKLCNNNPISPEEYKDLTTKMDELISKMPSGLNPLEQNLLDVFVDAIKDKNDINPRWREIVFSYYKIVDEKAKERLLEEKENRQNERRVLKIERLSNDTKGTVLTISILEITLIIGILIAFLIIALV